MSDMVQDLMTDDEFESLMELAAANTANDWEENFVQDMQERWDAYGRRMLLSERQHDHLKRIAEDR